jgi:hypothetical protein
MLANHLFKIILLVAAFDPDQAALVLQGLLLLPIIYLSFSSSSEITISGEIL